MTSDEEYQLTKDETDRLIQLYVEWLSETKGGFWSFKNLPKYAPMDYLIYKDNSLVFFLEVKFRRHEKGKYKQEKVPISKFTFAYTFSRILKKKSYLMTKWENTVGIVDLEDYDTIDKMTARHDRGEEYDLYAMYNCNKFTELKDLFFLFIQE